MRIRTNFGSAIALIAACFVLYCAAVVAQAQTFTVLHAFSGGDGAHPSAVPVLDRAGNLYGPTSSGTGNASNGIIYKLVHHGSGWLLNSLYDFAGGSDGAYPSSPITFDSTGTIYSVTLNGGSDNCTPSGCGTVFKLRPPASVCGSISCRWNETQLYNFDQGGAHPSSPVVMDQAGNIYGTAGGAGGLGVVYQLTPNSGGGWTETVLHQFEGNGDGAYPIGVISDALGNLYGTTYDGGPSGSCGTVFELSPSGSGWIFSVLYTFNCYDPDGGYLYGRPVLDAAGNLYATTSVGGENGTGTIFELSPQGNSWTYSLLYSFDYADPGSYPGTLTFDNAGNLYGVIYADLFVYGQVFELAHSAGGWNYVDLYDFSGGSDGAGPVDTVAMDASGNLYGAASDGGNTSCQYGCGTLWEITP